jgi:nucleoside-diphosphate-sugar epimerase
VPLVWDEDLADAVVLALARGARGAFNVSADDPLPPAELAAAAGLRHLPLPSTVLGFATRLSPLLARLGLGEPVDPAWQRHAEVAMVPSSERARSELGWRPSCATAVDVVRRQLAVSSGDARVALTSGGRPARETPRG